MALMKQVHSWCIPGWLKYLAPSDIFNEGYLVSYIQRVTWCQGLVWYYFKNGSRLQTMVNLSCTVQHMAPVITLPHQEEEGSLGLVSFVHGLVPGLWSHQAQQGRKSCHTRKHCRYLLVWVAIFLRGCTRNRIYPVQGFGNCIAL